MELEPCPGPQGRPQGPPLDPSLRLGWRKAARWASFYCLALFGPSSLCWYSPCPRPGLKSLLVSPAEAESHVTSHIRDKSWFSLSCVSATTAQDSQPCRFQLGEPSGPSGPAWDPAEGDLPSGVQVTVGALCVLWTGPLLMHKRQADGEGRKRVLNTEVGFFLEGIKYFFV